MARSRAYTFVLQAYVAGNAIGGQQEWVPTVLAPASTSARRARLPSAVFTRFKRVIQQRHRLGTATRVGQIV
ncbi:MAG: hypothetical protein AAGL24_11980 [Pseudomonadota bacterium]